MTTESAMNAAGRTTSHPFADIRSASLAHRRTKKYPRQKKSRKKGRCCLLCYPPHHLERLERRADAKFHIQARPWEDDWAAHRDFEEQLEAMDGVVRYGLFGRGGEGFEEWTGPEQDVDEWKASEEDFGTWENLHAYPQLEDDEACTDTTTLLSLSAMPATTLLTSVSHIDTDTFLEEDLTPSKPSLSLSCRTSTLSRYGFTCFDGSRWQWHRNYSGCREVGYPGACTDGPIPCSCCCVGNGSMYWPCHCADFGDQAAPEDMQRCSLVEWACGELLQIMEEEEKEEVSVVCEEDEEDVEVEVEEWEMMSYGDAASDGWSVVSDDEEFEALHYCQDAGLYRCAMQNQKGQQ
ncbi:hypothetical protein BKA66DRAFT_463112 [Pyrenochaeta sp. MPI-SDFR-AT-0127]|nr:hypothetical protein BKA66DRAFT_463112 [Pyrenochaeta sp. MPI-SDFR-AT-0127]